MLRRQRGQLILEHLAHLTAVGQALLIPQQALATQQLITLITQGNAGCSQITAVAPTRSRQIAPALLVQPGLLSHQVGLQGCGAGLDRSHMQHQAARFGRQQP